MVESLVAPTANSTPAACAVKLCPISAAAIAAKQNSRFTLKLPFPERSFGFKGNSTL
jgi:hypothetical protein